MGRHASEPLPALTEANFRAAAEQTRSRIPGLVPQLIDRVGVILKLGHEIQRRAGQTPVQTAAKSRTLSDLSQLGAASLDANRAANIWVSELELLLPRRFLETTSFAQLAHLPRYLKALSTRIERAKLNPAKDKERSQLIAPFVTALRTAQATPAKSKDLQERIEEFRWMLEEFKVSLFAQELGTAFPISKARLDQQLQRIRGG